MLWIHALLLVIGGALATSALVASKRPDAKLLSSLVPYQALIGVALLASALLLWFRFGITSSFRWVGHSPLFGVTLLGMIFSGLVLGFTFGMPQLAKWIPGESRAEVAAMQLSKRLVGAQTVIGVAAVSLAALGLLYAAGALNAGLRI